MSNEKKKNDDAFRRESVDKQSMEVPLGSLDVDAATFSFREETELKDDNKEIKKLADNIRASGLNVPLLVKKNGDRYLVIEGHRRRLAMRSLADAGDAGWTMESPVKCEVIVNDVSRLELLLRGADSNMNRSEISRP